MELKETGGACGRDHINPIDKILCAAGAIKALPEIVVTPLLI